MSSRGKKRRTKAGFLPEKIKDQRHYQDGENLTFNQGRIEELSRPKAPQSIWITSCGPKAMWGTQETLSPVTEAAARAKATSRLLELATPKRNFQYGEKINRPEFMYSCGRSSVLWQLDDATKSANASNRVMLLSQPKAAPREFIDKEDRKHHVFSCGRASPLWVLTSYDGKREKFNGPYIEGLARPKTVHNEYLPSRGVHSEITPGAMGAHPTPRLDSLATPKNRDEGPFREPQWPVPPSAKSATPTPRLGDLAKPKSLVDGYQHHREVIWSIPKSVKRAQCTGRLDELSRPIIRATMDHLQFDADAFLVKESALKARCSNRLEELSQPLAR